MALRELNFTFMPDDPRPLPVGWFHRGVTGSGDMEVMLEQRNLAGDVQVKVCTPVVGFDEVWERVLERFVKESGVSDVAIEINDNNATPVVVSMRLRQAIDEARKEAE